MVEETENYNTDGGGAVDNPAPFQSAPEPETQVSPPVKAQQPASALDAALSNKAENYLRQKAENKFGPEPQGLPKGARDRFRAGVDARQSGQTFKDAYRARKLPSVEGGAAAVKSGAAAAEGAAVKAAGSAAAKTATTAAKGAAEVGGRALPGVADIDYKHLVRAGRDAAQDLKELRVGRAAVRAVKGLGTSAAVTVFRVSYDLWVVGFSLGLSLIVTLVLGNILLPFSDTLNSLERLAILALDLVLVMFILSAIAIMLLVQCQVVPGAVIWLLSWFSSAATMFQSVCSMVGTG